MLWIKLPRLSVNDDDAVLHWQVADGEAVRPGQVVALLETLKTSAELEAEAEGFLRHLAPDGESARVGAIIAAVVSNADIGPEDVKRELAREQAAAQVKEPTRRWTKKAEIMARAAGIPLETTLGQGEAVTEGDVRAYLATRQAHPASLAEGYYFDAPGRPPVGRTRRVLVLGDGIGAAHVLDLMLRLPGFAPWGILDDDEAKIGRSVKGVPIRGPLGEARRLWEAGRYDGAVCLLQNRMELRKRVFEELSNAGVPFVNLIDPTAVVHSDVTIGQGNILQAFCRLGTACVVGDNNVLSAYVNVDHHSRLGSHCTFGPSVFTSGEVFIGDCVRFGSGICIEPRIRIGDNAVIGSGTTILGDIPDNALVKSRINYKIIQG